MLLTSPAPSSLLPASSFAPSDTHSQVGGRSMRSYSASFLANAPLLAHRRYLGNEKFSRQVMEGRSSGHQGVRAMAGEGGGQGDEGRQPWDFGRFARTFLFFNSPPSIQSVLSGIVSRVTGENSEKENVEAKAVGGGGGGGDVVLVVGATGGVGKRVVEELIQNGFRVRALVRDLEKGRKLLGPAIDMVAGDLTQKQTLLPHFFDGVSRIVNCASVVVGPKEGDSPDRQKYYQGIKFFDPEIKGDTPETVEYLGIRNLLQAVGPRLARRDGKVLFRVNQDGVPEGPAWGALDDVVMGGVSESSFRVDPSAGEHAEAVGIFSGVVSTNNNGGFASARTQNFTPAENLSAYEGLSLRLRGDGLRYKLILRTSPSWDAIGYTTSFQTEKDTWQTVFLPFSSFIPVFRAKTVPSAPPLDSSNICSLQLMLSKFEYDGALNPAFRAGPFSLPVASIHATLQAPITPRIVHVGSAGVTRPKRPGLDLSRQPPAVRLNDELGGILTFKLKGEDEIRGSHIPFTIIRPCALTEEPAGADLIFDQGDNITGKIGREEVARICVSALASPAATDKTFEVKSTVPFSEPFQVDPSNPPPRRDYSPFFEAIKEGITGKELLEEATVSV